MKVANVVSANKIIGGQVQNLQGEDLGEIKNLMIDLTEGRVAYAVLSFGGFLGIGNQLFAVPWDALTLKPDKQVYLLDVDKEALEDAPRFDEDEDNWPNMSDKRWGRKVYSHYSCEPYWEVQAR